MTWQPGPYESGRAEPPAWSLPVVGSPGPDPEIAAEPEAVLQERPGRLRRRVGWTAMVLLLGLGLCGLAGAAVGVAHQLLPRQFTVAQQRQIMTWEMTRRWRALSAGQIFPDTIAYQVPAQAVNASQPLTLDAHRLAISPGAGCAAGVASGAATVLAAGHCSALMRATYLDSSGSIAVTVGVAVLPDSQAASVAAHALAARGQDLALTVRALPVSGTVASKFGDSQRQLSHVMAAGPYLILSTAGFTDGRPHVRLASDYYYDQEMTSLVKGLTSATGKLLGATPPIARCPGSPGC